MIAIKGYKDASMAELAKITGVAQGTIFYHFTNKEELFLSILKAFKGSILEDFTHYSQNHYFTSGFEMMEEVIAFYFHMVGQS